MSRLAIVRMIGVLSVKITGVEAQVCQVCGYKKEKEAVARYQHQKLDTDLLVRAVVLAIAAAGPHWHPEM